MPAIAFPSPAGYTDTPWTDQNGKLWIADSKGRFSEFVAPGASAWADLTDKATAPLTTDNTALAAALAGKQPLSSVLTATTASFTTADETKLDGIASGATTAGAAGDAYASSHEADTTAHTAANIVNTPAGGIAATTVQAALNELDAEKAPTTITRTLAQGAPTHPTVPILAIGQMCRVGNSAPYTWYRAATLTSWGLDQETTGYLIISGHTILNGSVRDRVVTCIGTVVDYTVTLPSAAASEGAVLSFIMAPELSRFITLHSVNGIGGFSNVVMWSGETLQVVACNGTWQKIGGVSRPLMAGICGDSTPYIISGVETLATLNGLLFDNSGRMESSTSSKIIIRRTGRYRMKGDINFNVMAANASRCFTVIKKLPSTQLAFSEVAALGGSFPSPSLTCITDLVDGDEIAVYCYQNSGGAVALMNVGTTRSALIIEEIINSY